MDNKVKTLKMWLYTSIEVLCGFALSMMACMWDWVNAEFTFEQITTKAYWDNVLINTIMYSLAMILGTFFIIQQSELKSKDYENELVDYRKRLKEKKDNFVNYIETVLNPSIKKERLKKKAEVRLNILSKYAKDQWKLDFNDAIEQQQTNPNTPYLFSSKRSERYYKRRVALERQKSDEFVNKNWKALPVRYPRVNANAFTYYLDINANDNSKYKVENKLARDVPKQIGNKFINSFLFAGIIGMFMINPSTNELLEQANGWMVVVIRYIVRVFMIGMNLTMGIFAGVRLFKENFILPIHNRTEILDQYIAWNNAAGYENKSVAEIVEKAEKEAKEKAETEYNKKMEEELNKLKTEIQQTIQ